MCVCPFCLSICLKDNFKGYGWIFNEIEGDMDGLCAERKRLKFGRDQGHNWDTLTYL